MKGFLPVSNVNWMTVGLLCVSNLVMLYCRPSRIGRCIDALCCPASRPCKKGRAVTFNRQSRAASMLRASGVGTLCRFFRSASGQEVLRLREARRGRNRRAEGEGFVLTFRQN